MLEEHPITPVLAGHRPRRSQGVLTTASWGCRSSERTKMPSCSGCGSGTHLNVTNSTVGTADQHTQAAWQVTDIRAEMAELRTHGIKVEDFDTRGQRPKSWRTSRAGLAKLLARRSTSPSGSESVKGALLKNGRWRWCWSRLARMP